MKEILQTGFNEFITDFKNKNYKKQIANILTLSRFLSPFILLPLIFFNKMKLFIIMIIIFSLTDAFDGYFARKYGSISLFGKYLDSVVDKIFAITLLIPLLSNKLIIIITLLELFIAFLNYFSYKNNLNPHSTYTGKLKTVFLFILIGFCYLKKILKYNTNYLVILIIITIIMQLITILSYIKQIKESKTKQ